MYLIAQNFIYLAIAMIIAATIGYVVRACMADTACDDVREDLRLAQARYDDLLEKSQSPTPIAPAAKPPVLEPLNHDLAALSRRDLEAIILAAEPGRSPARRLAADDLTIIKGITPRLDHWLASLHITRFEHLLSLSPSELYWLVDNAPENGASLYRDNWLAQASAEMR
jgi:predicted flap endonuclease-1-like 5' DNA nuclease